mmetsp:Transcript_118437/g.252855  ORF Transcript_118437/g.252855 Transcript_118437/m.252855 type:complete len:211 (+) Transcript_118437:182-814(+)
MTTLMLVPQSSVAEQRPRRRGPKRRRGRARCPGPGARSRPTSPQPPHGPPLRHPVGAATTLRRQGATPCQYAARGSLGGRLCRKLGSKPPVCAAVITPTSGSAHRCGCRHCGPATTRSRALPLGAPATLPAPLPAPHRPATTPRLQLRQWAAPVKLLRRQAPASHRWGHRHCGHCGHYGRPKPSLRRGGRCWRVAHCPPRHPPHPPTTRP